MASGFPDRFSPLCQKWLAQAGTGATSPVEINNPAAASEKHSPIEVSSGMD
jgi:hypothetical protein